MHDKNSGPADIDKRENEYSSTDSSQSFSSDSDHDELIEKGDSSLSIAAPSFSDELQVSPVVYFFPSSISGHISIEVPLPNEKLYLAFAGIDYGGMENEIAAELKVGSIKEITYDLARKNGLLINDSLVKDMAYWNEKQEKLVAIPLPAVPIDKLNQAINNFANKKPADYQLLFNNCAHAVFNFMKDAGYLPPTDKASSIALPSKMARKALKVGLKAIKQRTQAIIKDDKLDDINKMIAISQSAIDYMSHKMNLYKLYQKDHLRLTANLSVLNTILEKLNECKQTLTLCQDPSSIAENYNKQSQLIRILVETSGLLNSMMQEVRGKTRSILEASMQHFPIEDLCRATLSNIKHDIDAQQRFSSLNDSRMFSPSLGYLKEVKYHLSNVDLSKSLKPELYMKFFQVYGVLNREQGKSSYAKNMANHLKAIKTELHHIEAFHIKPSKLNM